VLAGFARVPVALHGDWPIAAFAIGPAAALLGAHRLLERDLLHAGAGPVWVLGAFHILLLNAFAHGDAAPLPYLPLLGPADLALALLAVALVESWLRAGRPWPGVIGPAFAALAFVWLNGLLARSVAQWADVPFRASALWEATPFQSALSISWTLVALGGMVWCTRRGWRSRWIAAATLLGVTVAKLFVVDLSTLSTGAKIATFLVVGALLLVVGYLSPVPPARAEQGDAT
jgi:uncharacterized membrane protein